MFVVPKLLAGGLNAELVPNAEPVPPNPAKPLAPVGATNDYSNFGLIFTIV